MNNVRLLFGSLLVSASLTSFAQSSKNIVINEVLTNNTTSIQDAYGNRHAWIELENHSFSTYNVRGMYLTTDRSVLNKSMTVPERVKRMSVIPNGEDRTNLGAQKHLLLFGNALPTEGKLSLSLPIPSGESVWIALYNGNATELIDSVTVPALGPNESYARVKGKWEVKSAENVTPGIENFIVASESKIDKFKREDPHGFAMSIMAMGIVFLCLILLWLFFSVFGIIVRHAETAKKVVHKQPIKPITQTVEKTIEIAHTTGNILQDGFKMKGRDIEVYMAVIGMALRQYEEDVHDVESGIITIKPKDTNWDDEYSQMTQLHKPFMPTSSENSKIPTTQELY